MKKCLSLLLALCLLALPLTAFAAMTETDAVLSDTDAVPADGDPEEPAGTETTDAETMVFDSVADVATYILEPSPWGEIQIAPAVLSTAEGTRDVYLVALRGVGFSMNKTNNILACFLSAFNLESDFYRLTLKYINQYVPEGSAVVFAGHSLGGMIEQQLSCAEAFTSKYELLHTLNIGSPYVLVKAEQREGTLVRCVDSTDVIPKLGPGALLDLLHYNDYIKLDGGYLGNPDAAHNLSYQRQDVWGAYDALGEKDGVATLTLQKSEVITLSSRK